MLLCRLHTFCAHFIYLAYLLKPAVDQSYADVVPVANIVHCSR